MPIDFPASPEVGEAYEYNNRTWLWSGEVWTPDRPKYSVDRDIISDSDGYIVPSTTTATEVSFLGGVSSSIQTQLDSKAPVVSPLFTGEPSAPTANANQNDIQIATTAFVIGQASTTPPANSGTTAIGTSLRYARADHVHATDSTRAPLANPTFVGAITTGAGGVVFSDGAQTFQGVPSLTTIKPNITSNVTSSTLPSALTYRDTIAAVAGEFTITIDPDTTNSITFPTGTTLTFYQTVANGGASLVAGSPTVTLLATPGLVFRALHSSVSATKVAANTWLVFGDLKA